MVRKKLKVSELKSYLKNPRMITEEQMDLLKETLEELGDLGGIVHDLNTNEVIGGNQRVKAMAEGKIELTETLEEPDKQGTVIRGWVVWQGAKYSYRAVRWDEKTREKANIVANAAGGDWDYELLTKRFEIDDLYNWGFEAGSLDYYLERQEDIEVPEAITERVNFNIVCANMEEFEGMQELMGLDTGRMTYENFLKWLAIYCKKRKEESDGTKQE